MPPIRHEGPVHALALSRDERLLACGGAAGVPIAVWDLETGAVVARLTGLPREAHGLAFSPDSARVAAANLWGGLCVWDVCDGRLLATKPDTPGRRTRALVFPDSSPAREFPVVLTDSIFRPIRRALAPDGKRFAVALGSLRIFERRDATEVARLDPSTFAVCGSGVTHFAWSADGRRLAVAGEGWAGAWRPFEAEPHFYAARLPFSGRVNAVALLGESLRVIYAHDREVALLDVAGAAQQPALTKWQRFLLGAPAPPADGAWKPRRTWRWNVTASGHDGVHTLGASLVWYSESLPAYAGGWGDEQSFAAFLQDGPAYSIPEPLLVELYQAVRALAPEPS